MFSPIFQVDAFTTRRFGGNPAAVMPLAAFPPDDILQALAAENNLAETAFIVGGAGDYRLRWFTPTCEVPLCGHATLASAAVVMERLETGRASVEFQTLSGPLHVRRKGSFYVLNLPAYDPLTVAAPTGLAEALGIRTKDVAAYPGHLLVMAENADVLRGMAPDFAKLSRIDCKGVAVTALGDNGYDFISRFFAPAIGIPEDPVTGGAHCALVPYWAKRTGKSEFRAYQASARGGELQCLLLEDRAELTGSAVFYLEGKVEF
jgi:PhzF family phenazine biosynthesis protein